MSFATDVLNLAYATFYLNRPLLQANQTAQQQFTNGVSAVVDWGTSVVDNYGGFNQAANTYTVQVAGWYRSSAAVHWNVNSTGVRYCNTRKNGAALQFYANRTPSVQVVTCSSEGLVQCVVGDVLDVIAFQNSGGNLFTLDNPSFVPWWTLEWVRS